MTEKTRDEEVLDSGLENIQARLIKNIKGEWSLELLADTFNGKRTLDAVMAYFEYYRTHPPIILLSQCSKMYTSEESILHFNLDEGPDIVGTKEEIEKLQNWKTEEKSKKSPAHDVVLRKLRALRDKFNETNQALDYTKSRTGPFYEECARNKSCYCSQAMVLIEILTAMHIPKSARKELTEALRLLPSSFFPPMVVDILEEIEGDE